MDHQAFVNCVDLPCAVLSVQRTPAGTCGEIRIAVANQAYKDTMGPGYRDGMIYSDLVPQDNKFEDYCFRAAILKQRMHAYVETQAMDCWTDMTLIPMASGPDGLGYCQFIFEFTRQVEAHRMASVSLNTAETVIRACVKLMDSSDFQTNVGDVLKVIMEAAGARASRIMLVDREKRRLINFCERVHGDSRPNPNTDALSYDLVQTWEDMIGVSNAVIVQNERDMDALAEKNPAWAQSMRENLVRSLVLIPLRREKHVVGYMYVINFDVSKAVEVKQLVELMSFFLASEIYNHLLLQKLEDLSQVDALTGINNRRAMILRMRVLEACQTPTPYGVINIDLNGLKYANDHRGHEAGDKLLIQVGELLKKVFYHDDIFRTGGDEFIVITSDIDRETFERKARRLCADAEKNGLSFATGSFWSDGSEDLKAAFARADEMMYADKKAFYDLHPELVRK